MSCNEPNHKMESICLFLALYLILKFKSIGACIAFMVGSTYHFTGKQWARFLDKIVLSILMFHCIHKSKWCLTPYIAIFIIIASMCNNCKRNWIIHSTCIQIPMFICWYKMLLSN